MWDKPDKSLIPSLLHRDFTFRGSLGQVLQGHEHFADYIDFVNKALRKNTNDILNMVEEGDKVFAKLRYHGYHVGEFFGFQPTGRHVWWYGTPLFTFDGPKVRDLWVLGDIHGLKETLALRTSRHHSHAAQANDLKPNALRQAGLSLSGEEDVYICPAGERLIRSFTTEEHGLVLHRYLTNVCQSVTLGIAVPQPRSNGSRDGSTSKFSKPFGAGSTSIPRRCASAAKRSSIHLER
jgi:predicted ester cyclase